MPRLDEGRLLTDKELFELHPWLGDVDLTVHRFTAGKQDAKTASIKDAECQARVERIFKIIDYIKAVENYPLAEGQLESMVILHFDIPDAEAKKIVRALKKKEEK